MLLQGLPGAHAPIADRAHEADVVEDVLERFVCIAQYAKGFIERTPERVGRAVDVCLQIASSRYLTSNREGPPTRSACSVC